MEKREPWRKILFYLYLWPLLLVAAWCGLNVHHKSNERALIKDDFSEVNGIEYGLLSVNSWKDQIQDIIATQIDSFSLSGEQDSLLREQITDILNQMVTKADSVVQASDKTFRGKLRKALVNFFVNKNEVKREVPGFSDAIVNELQKPKSKQRLKKLAKQKLNEYARETYSNSDSLWLSEMYKKYRTDNREDFNKVVSSEAQNLQDEIYKLSFAMLAVIFLFLLPWIIVQRKEWKFLDKPLFNLSIILAIIVLLTGISSAMIEIDARISKVDFVLLGNHVLFHNQMLFFRSKSILQVVQILLNTKKFDSVLVGCLVLAFSVLFPISKLVSTEIFLFGSERMKSSKIIHWLTFKSGKWSMADVMVVAIFMAYVGFKGILDNQLEMVNIKTESLTSIATNYTSLQPGFILFLSFVLYSLFISQLLQRTVVAGKAL